MREKKETNSRWAKKSKPPGTGILSLITLLISSSQQERKRRRRTRFERDARDNRKLVIVNFKWVIIRVSIEPITMSKFKIIVL
jgi:hypothetical protein